MNRQPFVYDIDNIEETDYDIIEDGDHEAGIEKCLNEMDIQGIYVKQCKNEMPKLLKKEEEVQLFKNMENNCLKSKNRIIEANLRLVMHIGKRFKEKGLDMMDIVQLGNIGLIEAVNRFDHTKGFRFSTYASLWIRQTITRGISNDSRTIRLPVHAHALAYTIKKTIPQLTQEQFKFPTNESIAKKSGLKLKAVIDTRRDIFHTSKIMSMDSLITGTLTNQPISDLIKDEREDLEGKAVNGALRSNMLKCMDILNDRERMILKLRYGFDDGYIMTLGEISDSMKICKERVRQLEIAAFKKVQAKFKKSYPDYKGV